MEEEIVDVEPDRVRILSSLEPRKRAADPRARKSQRQRKAARAKLWSRALVGMMLLGLVTVATGVYLLIRSAHDTEQALSSWPVPATAAEFGHAGELQMAPPAAGPLTTTVAEAEAAALINVPAEADAPEALDDRARMDAAVAAAASAAAALSPTGSSAVSDANRTPVAEADPLAALKPSPAGAARAAGSAPPAPSAGAGTASSTAAKAQPTAAPPKTAAVAPAAVPTPAAARPASRADADVALLEAVFPQHDPQKASKTDLFRACQGMSGAEASICRARICVQHPGVPACQ